MTTEIAPVTPEPAGMEHAIYVPKLLERFANAALNHRTWQIAMDGSQKLPQRILNTVRDRLCGGKGVEGLCLVIAAWMRYGLGFDENGDSIDVSDPLAGRFREIAGTSGTDADAIVRGFLSIDEVFGADLPREPAFVRGVTAQLRRLLKHGAAATVAMQAGQGDVAR